MPICTKTCFQQGGRELIELLTHCVLSFNTDVLFLYLTREYQFRPQAVSAVALYDVFCAPQAPARISDTSLIPPGDLRLDQTIAELRRALQIATGDHNASDQATTEHGVDDACPDRDHVMPLAPAIPLPPHFLFDPIAARLSAENPKLSALESYYDPKLTPHENLPGGKLSVGGRAFVDHVWTPRIRPYLVASGFWRLATVG
ncbi:hypothetical protein Mal15_54800 [Stieleria maiorica]|uniref:Uncharacterized protein n=1 Tax=Stieleria maiorica TaxID=2795974 RepID=A0A5B9MKH4_9BACT|nr:hypothetical protein [Stieleria maiorica]QEG01404.1 hypothetical protein Mal15_54800 [Stieleria maiorica]